MVDRLPPPLHIKYEVRLDYMNNGMQVFENSDFGKVRVVERDGEPWFVAADVCRALGLEQVSRALDRLDEDERGLLKVTHPQSPSKTQEVNGVNEPGLYHLVLCSTKPEAKAFKRWITHEVLSSIRKTGIYSNRESDGCVIDNPIARAQRWIEETQERLAVPSTREWDVTCVHHVQQANIACC